MISCNLNTWVMPSFITSIDCLLLIQKKLKKKKKEEEKNDDNNVQTLPGILI
jgi:hypothetical protein